MVDGGEITEATREAARRDDGFCVGETARRNLQRAAADALLLRQERDERVLDGLCSRRRLQLRRRTCCQDPAGVHRDEPIEPLGLLHVGCRDDDAHAPAARSDPLDQLPELAARQRVDTRRGFVEDQEVGIVDQRAAKSELLLHSARQFFRRTVGKRRKPGAVEKLGDAALPFGTGLSEQAAKELDVFADAKIGIEVFAEALWHIGDARADRGAVRRIGDVPAEDTHLPGLDLPSAGDDGEQRRLADAVGPNQPDHAAGRQRERDAVECGPLSVTMRDVVEARDRIAAPGHGGALACSLGGQSIEGSVRT